MSDASESVKRDPLETVRRMAVSWRASADTAQKANNHERAAFFNQSAEDCVAVVHEVERLRGLTKALPRFRGEDISDLPPSLQKELSVTKTDELEDQLVTLIRAAGGEADIDTLLVGLWRRFKVEQNRRFLQNKLWRMTQKEMLWSVPGRKGVYSTLPQEIEPPTDDNPPPAASPEEYFVDEEGEDESVPF